MKKGSSLSCRKHPELAFCLAALLLACEFAHAQQPRRPCPGEFTKPLLEVLHDKDLQETDPIRVRSAIEELGQRRCVEVIDDLVSLLMFRFPFPRQSDEPVARLQPNLTGTRFPAADALSMIGQQALPALVKVIETNDFASLLSKNARYTGRAIFAYRKAEGDKFFEEAAAEASTPEAKRRLLRALETAQEDMRSD